MAIVLNFVRSICGFLFLLLFYKIHETTSLQRLNTPENTPCAWHSSPIQNGGRKLGVVLERVYWLKPSYIFWHRCQKNQLLQNLMEYSGLSFSTVRPCACSRAHVIGFHTSVGGINWRSSGANSRANHVLAAALHRLAATRKATRPTEDPGLHKAKVGTPKVW